MLLMTLYIYDKKLTKSKELNGSVACELSKSLYGDLHAITTVRVCKSCHGSKEIPNSRLLGGKGASCSLKVIRFFGPSQSPGGPKLHFGQIQPDFCASKAEGGALISTLDNQ